MHEHFQNLMKDMGHKLEKPLNSKMRQIKRGKDTNFRVKLKKSNTERKY